MYFRYELFNAPYKRRSKFFEENEKFYSLFITVNRIDERYASGSEHSINRILDYISGRLEDLNYKNIVIFGTSALQSFYLDTALNLFKETEIIIDRGKTFSQVIRQLKKRRRDCMTPIRFVEDRLKDLEDFHGNYNADTKTLKNLIVGINKPSAKKLEQLIEAEGINFSKKVESAVQKVQQTIIEETERVKNSVSSDSVAGDMIRAFSVPQFTLSHSKSSQRIDKETGTYTYTVTIKNYDAKTFKSNVQHLLQELVIEAIEKAHDEMKTT